MLADVAGAVAWSPDASSAAAARRRAAGPAAWPTGARRPREDETTYRRLTVVHADPRRQRATCGGCSARGRSTRSGRGVARVVRTGRAPGGHRRADAAALVSGDEPERERLVSELGVAGYVSVPLRAHDAAARRADARRGRRHAGASLTTTSRWPRRWPAWPRSSIAERAPATRDARRPQPAPGRAAGRALAPAPHAAHRDAGLAAARRATAATGAEPRARSTPSSATAARWAASSTTCSTRAGVLTGGASITRRPLDLAGRSSSTRWPSADAARPATRACTSRPSWTRLRPPTSATPRRLEQVAVGARWPTR